MARVVVAFALICSSCWTDAKPEPVSSTIDASDAQLTGTVLVWADAPLYLEPSTAAPSLQLARIASRPDRLGASAPMTVISTSGSFVEVEPIVDEQCGGINFLAPGDLAHVHVFVRRHDLAPVLARPYIKEFADGTEVALRPGVAVASDRGGYRVALAGDIVTLPIPDSAVGVTYRHYHERDTSADEDLYSITDVTAQLGPTTVHVRGEHDALRVDKAPHGAALFPMHEACRDFVLAVRATDVAPTSTGTGSFGTIGVGGGVSTKVVDYLPAGTPLRSGDHVVATTAAPIVVPALRRDPPCLDREWTLSIDDRRGPDIERTQPPVNTMHVCADASAVVSGPLNAP